MSVLGVGLAREAVTPNHNTLGDRNDRVGRVALGLITLTCPSCDKLSLWSEYKVFALESSGRGTMTFLTVCGLSMADTSQGPLFILSSSCCWINDWVSLDFLQEWNQWCDSH
jgi:hypothetical protein